MSAFLKRRVSILGLGCVISLNVTLIVRLPSTVPDLTVFPDASAIFTAICHFTFLPICTNPNPHCRRCQLAYLSINTLINIYRVKLEQCQCRLYLFNSKSENMRHSMVGGARYADSVDRGKEDDLRQTIHCW